MVDFNCIIAVRDSGQTYIARGNGKTASCTAGPEQAVERVARKIFGNQPFTLKKVTRLTYIATEEGKSEI